MRKTTGPELPEIHHHQITPHLAEASESNDLAQSNSDFFNKKGSA
jgi:hypothetical protein